MSQNAHWQKFINCADMKVHANKIYESGIETYIRDKIHKSCKNQQNITHCVKKGLGIVSTILAMCKDAMFFKWATV